VSEAVSTLVSPLLTDRIRVIIMDLFDNSTMLRGDRPLADRMRPRELDEFLGQEDILGHGKVLRRAVEEDRLFSMLFWGPPGTGKTTLARIIAGVSKSNFVHHSAVSAGVKEIREVVRKAGEDLKYSGTKTILFLDEIHRFNKAQQDYLLPHVENGTLLLIGATTENPGFEVNPALRSRLRVFIFQFLSHEDLKTILRRALQDTDHGLGSLEAHLDDDAEELIVSLAGGDARSALNILEQAAGEAHAHSDGKVDRELVKNALQKRNLIYDKSGEEHFNIISALHKSVRDSDPDAALYWMGRMLEGGEDPLYIARRLIRAASEDVGLASPRALEQSVAAFQACQTVGPPECHLALAQATVFLATAPKSNALYTGYKAVKKEIDRTGHLPVPMHIRNAGTSFMKQVGYGKGYRYAHDHEGARVEQEHLPEEIRDKRFYHPTDRGFEETIRQRMKWSPTEE
jgi:putative ATPase